MVHCVVCDDLELHVVMAGVVRSVGEGDRMSALYVVVGLVALALLVYLVVALLAPESF